MHTQNFVINETGNRHAVEHVRECLPQAYIIAPFALIKEPVYAIDAGALVVATHHEEVRWILDFVGQEQHDALQTLLATVDVVTAWAKRRERRQ